MGRQVRVACNRALAGHLQPVENSTSNACLRLKAAFYPRSLHDRRCLFLLRTCYPGNVL